MFHCPESDGCGNDPCEQCGGIEAHVAGECGIGGDADFFREEYVHGDQCADRG